MFKYNINNFQEISNKSNKSDISDKIHEIHAQVEYNYLIDLLFRLCSVIILLFSIILVSILLYYSLKN
jgi:hypothetical protein